jgi:23S rRNA (pseudouridine1915-N3)-methyltransferase
MITIIAVGKKHEDWIQLGLERYQKRLTRPFDVKWILLPHSSLSGDSARLEETERIRQRLPAKDAHVVLLDERGQRVDSPGFSRLIEEQSAHSRPVVFIIGGAYGVDEALHRTANSVVSLSDLVFPHQLVRLLLIEQIYRAQSIADGGKYHHA